MKVEILNKETKEAKVLAICLKVVDNFTANLLDEKGEVIKEYHDYVPDFMPEEHFGDYVELDIDIETGQILNWKKPTKKQIEKFIRK